MKDATKIAAVVALLFFVTGVWMFRPPDPIAIAINTQICASHAKPLDLGQLADFDWDSLVVLTPRSTQASADQALGFHWADYQDVMPSFFLNSYDVLLFLWKGEIVHVVRQPRGLGDFQDKGLNRRIDRARATFNVEMHGRTCSWPYLTLQGALPPLTH